MSRPIGNTPTLEWEDAIEFFKRMKQGIIKKDKKLNEKIKKQRKVPYYLFYWIY